MCKTKGRETVLKTSDKLSSQLTPCIWLEWPKVSKTSLTKARINNKKKNNLDFLF